MCHLFETDECDGARLRNSQRARWSVTEVGREAKRSSSWDKGRMADKVGWEGNNIRPSAALEVETRKEGKMPSYFEGLTLIAEWSVDRTRFASRAHRQSFQDA